MITRFETISHFVSLFGFDALQTAPFYIYKYEDAQYTTDFDFRSYQHCFFEISLDLSHGCPYQVDQFQVLAGSNRLSVISPYRLQSIFVSQAAHEVNRGYSFYFKPEFLSMNPGNAALADWLPLAGHTVSPMVTPDAETLLELVDVFEKIHFYQHLSTADSMLIVRHYAHILMVLVRKAFAHQQQLVTSREHELYSGFMQLLENRFLELHRVTDYADQAHVSTKHFSESIKNLTGKSPLQLIQEKRADYAKSLLLQTQFSSSRIALELNFENEGYFSTFFKRMTGVTPSQFRKIQHTLRIS